MEVSNAIQLFFFLSFTDRYDFALTNYGRKGLYIIMIRSFLDIYMIRLGKLQAPT